MLLSNAAKQARSSICAGIRGAIGAKNLAFANDWTRDRLGCVDRRRISAPNMGLSRGMASEVQRSNTSNSGLVETGGGLGGTSGVSKRTDRKCTLVLEDGSVFSGQSFGCEVRFPENVFEKKLVSDPCNE